MTRCTWSLYAACSAGTKALETLCCRSDSNHTAGRSRPKWKIGERIEIGWHGGDNHVTGLTIDGDYDEYMVAFEESLSRIPDELSALEAAPLSRAAGTKKKEFAILVHIIISILNKKIRLSH
ncbi:D-arabinose 1-dehydrogenase-like Zn-dependent alcohol dehydrogenase [Paenibacillus sp. V4I3]|uniref:hypothetical protein n=1 Tax=unclassified Paenibacillus TaxID=185978 RepID=UPI00277DF0F3|nr:MULTISPECIES: hypothetical protein [unclassified Paenibacillus]MDQ0875986.1 D-arabinose 1-dehydrogenase-like Zn-dependent alcohol dehydrogenase [Paenibacillus sp. V4I3]MDQ0887998.1 D-arabinose 1-dehydrogenase-like Zn-dependent alcohol dehydrogenase [Paenibacillus sp. V4I9]